MKLLMEPLVVAAILMKELPDKQVGSAESAKDASAAPEFQRTTRRNKDFSGRGASPSAPCMTWFSLLFSSFFLSLSFLGARSQQPPAPRRQPEFQQIRAVFCWGIFVVAGAAGFVLCVLILHVAEGFASADATKGHENKRSLRSPFGNLRRAP